MFARIFGWIGRQALLYLLLVVAIGIGHFVVPWVAQSLAGHGRAVMRHEVLQVAQTGLDKASSKARAEFASTAAALRGRSLAELDARVTALTGERVSLERNVANAPPRWQLALLGPDAVLAVERQRLRLALLDQELAAVAAARTMVATDGAAASAMVDLRAQQAAARHAIAACAASRAAVQGYEARWRWRVRSWFDNPEHRRLVGARDADCAAQASAVARFRQLEQVARAKIAVQRSARAAFDQAAAAPAAIERIAADLAADAKKAEVELSGRFEEKMRLWAERIRLPGLLAQAAVALALIVATPFLIRLFCYYVLAPIAMRRPAIRLAVPGGMGRAIAPAARSATSVGVRLEPGEELLVRQDYLQTTSHAGAKDTLWWLRGKPLTSLATGLTFLTRIRGDGEVTTISAVRDPFAEVTIVTLPDGGSCVLQPRALAAVAQPIDRPLRVTAKWRLGSLNAWLTLQLRYLVFHGPARLVVKGGRGVRVERAERGRVFGQDQLVGFSADLAYSVTRTETFWPYFLGRESLLKDRVEAGEGVLIVEEAPVSARTGEPRRGIEGMIDAAMKAFGM